MDRIHGRPKKSEDEKALTKVLAFYKKYKKIEKISNEDIINSRINFSGFKKNIGKPPVPVETQKTRLLDKIKKAEEEYIKICLQNNVEPADIQQLVKKIKVEKQVGRDRVILLRAHIRRKLNIIDKLEYEHKEKDLKKKKNTRYPGRNYVPIEDRKKKIYDQIDLAKQELEMLFAKMDKSKKLKYDIMEEKNQYRNLLKKPKKWGFESDSDYEIRLGKEILENKKLAEEKLLKINDLENELKEDTNDKNNNPVNIANNEKVRYQKLLTNRKKIDNKISVMEKKLGINQ